MTPLPEDKESLQQVEGLLTPLQLELLKICENLQKKYVYFSRVNLFWNEIVFFWNMSKIQKIILSHFKINSLLINKNNY